MKRSTSIIEKETKSFENIVPSTVRFEVFMG